MEHWTTKEEEGHFVRIREGLWVCLHTVHRVGDRGLARHPCVCHLPTGNPWPGGKTPQRFQRDLTPDSAPNQPRAREVCSALSFLVWGWGLKRTRLHCAGEGGGSTQGLAKW